MSLYCGESKVVKRSKEKKGPKAGGTLTVTDIFRMHIGMDEEYGYRGLL